MFCYLIARNNDLVIGFSNSRLRTSSFAATPFSWWLELETFIPVNFAARTNLFIHHTACKNKNVIIQFPVAFYSPLITLAVTAHRGASARETHVLISVDLQLKYT